MNPLKILYFYKNNSNKKSLILIKLLGETIEGDSQY